MKLNVEDRKEKKRNRMDKYDVAAFIKMSDISK